MGPIALVIPAYRVRNQILNVLMEIGPIPSLIYVIDDGCPENSGDLVEAHCKDSRVRVLRHKDNCGVGAAVITGFRAALMDGAGVIVKLDGDGQMDPSLLPVLTEPIQSGLADYVKGNRFHGLSGLEQMPMIRLLGNAALSFMAKASTGYWQLFDPTNGYVAIDSRVAHLLIRERLSRRYFFETDVLFRLYLLGAVVMEIPHQARYGEEKSSLQPLAVIFPFLTRHLVNTGKRIFYTYFLRSFYPASLELVIGSILAVTSITFAAFNWATSVSSGVPRTSGTVVIASTMMIIASQCLLAFLNFDVSQYPRSPLSTRLPPLS